MATKSIPIVSNFLNLLAKSILVPTPSVQATITGSLTLMLLMSNKEPNPPIISFLDISFVFLTFLLDTLDIYLTKLLANDMSTPLFYNYFHFFIYKLIIKFYEITQNNIYSNCFFKTETLFQKMNCLLLIIFR